MPEAGNELIKVACSKCGSKYSLPQERLKGRVLKIRCKSCDTIFEVRDKSPQSISSRGQRRWFVVINRERVGPMTAQQVRDRFSRGEVTLRSYVWRQGMEKWERLHRVGEFGDVSDALEETRPPIVERGIGKAPGRANTLRLVRLGSSKEDAAANGDAGWRQVATRAADLSGMAALSELQRQQEVDRDYRTDEEDEDAEGPTQVRRVGPKAAAEMGPLYESEEETTRRAVYVDKETGEPRVEDEPPEEEKTRKTSLEALARAKTDNEEDDAGPTMVDERRKSGEQALDELAEFAENLDAISKDGVALDDHADTIETDRPITSAPTGPEIAVEPPLRPGAKGRRLAQERGQDSVLFSLDHLKADAAQSFARAPTAEPKRRAQPVEERDDPTPMAEELYVGASEPPSARGGGLRFVLGMLVGAVLIFGVLFAVNPSGMKRLLGLTQNNQADDLKVPGKAQSGKSADAMLVAARAKPDAGQGGAAQPSADAKVTAPDRGVTPDLAPPKPDLAVPEDLAAQSAKKPQAVSAKKAPTRPKKPAPRVAAKKPAIKKALKPRPKRRRRPRVKPADDGPDPVVEVVDDPPPDKPKPKPAPQKPKEPVEVKPTKPEDKTPSKPAAKPAPKPTEKKAPASAVPTTLTRAQVTAGLNKARAAIKACASEGGMLTVEVTISGALGRAVAARVLGALVEDGVKRCVAQAVKNQARFPKFSQEKMTTKVPLVLR